MISSLRGATTHEKNCVAQYLLAAHGACAVMLLLGLLASTPVAAQGRVPLTLMEAEDRALEQEPGQAAFRARANALEEQSVAAEQLPDPELRVGIANFPIQSGGFTTEGMTQAQIAVRQAFPAGNSRTASTSQFQSLAAEMSQSAEARGRDVLTAVRKAWLEAYYWEQADSIVSEARPFFTDLLTVTRSLYAVGSKDQQDVLRAELELSRLDDRLISISRQGAGARAALSEWIGAESARPVAAKLPAWEQLPPLETLRVDLLNHPALRAADARIDAQRAGIDLAQENKKSGWALDLGYGYRDGFMTDGTPRSDFVSLSVTMDLPLFGENRQDRQLSAALSERRAADESKQQLLRRLASQLDAEYARWQGLSSRIDLYERSILGQTNAQANAALAAYQSESGDFADVMHGFIDDLNTRLDYIRLQIDRAQSYAVLANLGGLPR